VIERRRAVQTPLVPWVFYRARRRKIWPVGRFDKVWRKACAQAGVEGRLVHDFRRSVVRNMTRAGVPKKSRWPLVGIRPVRFLTAITLRMRRISGRARRAPRTILPDDGPPFFG